MSLLLLENYIKQALILNENTIEPDQPTFGEVKALLGLVSKKNRTKKYLGAGLKAVASLVKAKIDLAGTAIEIVSGKEVLNHDMVDDTIDMIGSALSKKLGTKIDFNSMGPEKILAKMYGVNDRPGLKKLEVPDEVSELIDDKVEEKFMSWMWEEIKKQPDDKIISDGWVLEQLKEYTKNVNAKTQGAFAQN